MYDYVKSLVIFLAAISLPSFVRGQNYCTISSCSANQQTMCRFPNSGASSQCSEYVAAPLNDTEKIALVNVHNEYRQRVASGLETQGNPGPQPSASNMYQLQWDSELATVAQRWADQCASGHDTCRNVARFDVGQNILTKWSTGELNDAVASLVQPWYNEVSKFNNSYVQNYRFTSDTGHYSQLVWAQTKFIGCGRVRFWDPSMSMNTLRLICNYGPAGNYIGSSVYKIGTARSACPNGTGTIAGLCN